MTLMSKFLKCQVNKGNCIDMGKKEVNDPDNLYIIFVQRTRSQKNAIMCSSFIFLAHLSLHGDLIV